MKLSLPPFPLKIIETLEKAGFEAYIVGGAVRDLLTKKSIKDWDFTTNAKPEKIKKLFPKAFYDNTFGTVGIAEQHLAEQFSRAAKIYKTIDQRHIYEITTFRTEENYTDRRRPDKVFWGKTLKQDLQRRDLTINAMGLKIQSKTKIEIIDPYNGQKDLQNKIIRAVGDPNQRFQEDALRLMRAIRIAAQLGFTLEENTFQAIQKNAFLINHIAAERIRHELQRIIESKHPADGILLLKNAGLLIEILPELEKAVGVLQKGHHTLDVFNHSIASLRRCPSKNWLVRFATLLHDIGKPFTKKFLCPQCQIQFKAQEAEFIICPQCRQKHNAWDIGIFYNHEIIGARITRTIAKRLKLSKSETVKLVKLVRWHGFAVNPELSDKALRRFIRHINQENLSDILDLRTGDRLGGGARETSWRLELFKKRLDQVQIIPFNLSDLKINGHDVMKILNLKPGPQIGQILNQLFKMVENKAIENKRKTLLEQIAKFKIIKQAKPA